MTTIRKALVIGGGVAGPVASMALQQAGIDAVVCERYEGTADGVGGGMGIAPNGQDALAAVDAGHLLAEVGLPMPVIAMFSGTGKRLATFTEPPSVPASTQALMRADLYRLIYAEAKRRGIAIKHGKDLVRLEDDGASVTAFFADGTSETADVLIGADGIRSTVRALIDGDSPQPTYTGLVSFGGWVDHTSLPSTGGECRLTFGSDVFSGHLITDDGQGFWFINMPSPTPMTIDQMRRTPAESWLDMLRDKVSQDNSHIRELLAQAAPQDLIITGASEYLPHVPVWHRGRTMLIGDACHAPSSSSGQGASMALEDAVQLARCLRDLPTVQDAFAGFEALRRPRLARLIKDTERANGNKTAHGAARVLRDLIMPVMMKLFFKPEQRDWLYAHHIDWAAPIGPEIAAAQASA
ncbi:2-polyprenyl-6-methoxyphenol hydroxylase-like FAD-dependent oxidoreductase [Allocatelliglobosispora scoriae]|uniref:2-polyprenyl-6-methoxyphenol hydroxylase-like FAD-dependent oxidoreductase n=1 Tax=Allocatelliglobosispora scoriae TaxID=643052 RepID=A0A841C3V0_9ACTN|nr:FAD-dependent monooxygenase [Allocatelliglobosispora scoriae]MBB5874606.1 2-polyprenyl-6-methoxyphenol hydroxylase-like FAD-dependent oxidoreductase [Allocatelliglobosispora scoriae]